MNCATFGLNRREFLSVASGSVAGVLLGGAGAFGQGQKDKSRPNFLWISAEDLSPDLGCYGDKYAVTPNLDGFASQSVRYDRVFSHAGASAPSQSGIVTGMYSTTIGTQHMRCRGVPPYYVKCASEHLRAVGYYCTNNGKTDYSFDCPRTAWDECGGAAHWRNRPKGSPFFAVINFSTTHESRIRDRGAEMTKEISGLGVATRHDPAKAQLPPYYPDTPRVREDWARYYDLVTLMDKRVKEVLDQLAADGLAEDTIVWFWGVSGRGLPRAKRWVYDSGTRVPLIVRVPEKWRKTAMPGNPDALKPGSACDELIASVDFAPTVLSLAGVEIPKRMQGRAFLGRQKGKPREYVYGARDRTDEAYDLIRTVRDGRFRYVRNYMWHVPRSQAIACVEQMPTMQEMRRLHAEGKLQGPPTQYFEPAKPVEELYDTAADPHEVNNLASDPKWQETLVRMRQAHQEWRRGTMDIGLIPEPLFDEMKRPGGQIEKTADPVFVKFSGGKEGGTAAIACATLGASVVWRIGGDPKQESGWNLYVRPVPIQPGETLHAQACRLGFHDSGVVAFKIGDAIVDKPEPIHADHWADKSDLAGQRQRLVKIKDLDFKGPNATTEFLAHLQDPKPAVRYWAVVGLHVWTKYSVDLAMAKPAVTTMLEDPSMVVRVAAAHAMCDWGEERIGLPILAEALKNSSDKTRMLAMVALDSIGGMARPVLPQIQAAAQDSDEYVALVAGAVVSGLDRK